MASENAGKTSDVTSLKFGKLSLRFVNQETERRFSDEHLVRSLPIIRLSMVTGALLYGLFGILDIIVVPDVLAEVWLIRFAVVCPFLLGMLLFSFTRYFARSAQLVLSLCMLVSGLGIIAMTAITSPPASYFYYAGLILIVIYCSSLIRLRFVYSTAISLALFVLYQIVAIFVNPVPAQVLFNNNFFLVVSVAVGIFSCYAQEFFIRHDYVNTQLLLREKARSEELLQEARAGSRAKSDFLAMVSHELRTPLNAIIGFSEMIKQQMFGPLGSRRYGAYAEDIYNSGKHLLYIINNILDLSKAEAGMLTLNEEEVDLCEALDKCLRLFREEAARQGVRLAFDVPVDKLRLYVDPQLLSQVLINLISNAIKFTQRGGEVVLSVMREADGGVHMRIEDTGVGITKDNLSKVVEPFIQVESAFTRKHEGTGLGLPLVKKIMDLHGGDLEIASSLGVGTTVTARFPAARVIAPEAALPARRAVRGA